MLAWLSIGLGVLLIVLGLRDIFLTLLTPTGRGSLSHELMAASWRLTSPIVRRWRRYREVVGPIMFVGVVGAWATMIVVGWALIYWPFLPDEFLVDFGLDLQRDSPGNLLTALYLSMVVLGTIGFGDIVPTGSWLRLLVPLEGLIGFGLITAGISWFLSIDPALSRRRRLAHRIALVREAEESLGERWGPETMGELLESFATDLIEIRSDQLQFPIIYYFRDADPQADLIPSLAYLRGVAARANEEFGTDHHTVHLHQHMLRRAIDDYIHTIATQFLPGIGDDPEIAFDALMRDHESIRMDASP